MNRVPLVFVFCLVLLAKGATPASADSAVTFVRKFLTGKALDYIWDQASGTPDVKLLDRRLRELEGNTATRLEVRDEVRRLRQRIHAKVSRDEFQKLAEETSQQILSISQRLDELEERVERLEVEQEGRQEGHDKREFSRVLRQSRQSIRPKPTTSSRPWPTMPWPCVLIGQRVSSRGPLPPL
jgi:hypothetical protein